MRHHKILFYLLFLKMLWRCHTDLELVDESLNIFSLRQLAFGTSFDLVTRNRLLVTVGNISTWLLGILGETIPWILLVEIPSISKFTWEFVAGWVWWWFHTESGHSGGSRSKSTGSFFTKWRIRTSFVCLVCSRSRWIIECLLEPLRLYRVYNLWRC